MCSGMPTFSMLMTPERKQPRSESAAPSRKQHQGILPVPFYRQSPKWQSRRRFLGEYNMYYVCMYQSQHHCDGDEDDKPDYTKLHNIGITNATYDHMYPERNTGTKNVPTEIRHIWHF